MTCDFVAPMHRGCFKWLHPAFLPAWYNQLRETRQTPPNDKSTFLMECLLTDGGAGRRCTFWLWLRQHSQCSQGNSDVSFPQISHIFPNLFFVTLYNSHFPTSDLCWAEMHLLNVPSATAADAEEIVDAEVSGWCTPPEHHSLKKLDFFKRTFHVCSKKESSH